MENYFEPNLTDDQLRAISSIGLAHMGDAVFEVLVRTWLCAHGKATGRGLHQATIALVRAESQAEKAERILPLLTEEEAAVFRRGRNAHVKSVPGHATRAQYGEATALEALLGWLYLKGRRDRMGCGKRRPGRRDPDFGVHPADQVPLSLRFHRADEL